MGEKETLYTINDACVGGEIFRVIGNCDGPRGNRHDRTTRNRSIWREKTIVAINTVVGDSSERLDILSTHITSPFPLRIRRGNVLVQRGRVDVGCG